MLPPPPPPPPRGTTIATNLLLSSSLFSAAVSFLAIFKPSLPPPLHRTLNPPSMNPSSPPRLTFSSPDSLADWLSPRLPTGSLASWGTLPGTKTVHNLFLELTHGETSFLPNHPIPLRTVRVVTVHIRNPRGALLVESHQLLSDGSVRIRHRPLSEKMLPDESPEDAAVRALHEELGEDVAARGRIVPGSCRIRVEDRGSASYPGLPARYVLHSVEAEVEGLPEEGEFSTEEAGEGLEAQDEKAVFVRRHFWKWIDDDGHLSA